MIANPTEYSTLRPRTLPCSVEPVQQLVGGAGAVGADQQLPAVGGGDLGDRVGEHLDVVGGGVRPGVPGAQHRGQELAGVVAPHPERVEPEGPLERGRGVLLLGVRDHDRGVDVEHDRVAEVGAGDPAGRDTAGQLRPDVAADPGPRGLRSSSTVPG